MSYDAYYLAFIQSAAGLPAARLTESRRHTPSQPSEIMQSRADVAHDLFPSEEDDLGDEPQ